MFDDVRHALRGYKEEFDVKRPGWQFPEAAFFCHSTSQDLPEVSVFARHLGRRMWFQGACVAVSLPEVQLIFGDLGQNAVAATRAQILRWCSE